MRTASGVLRALAALLLVGGLVGCGSGVTDVAGGADTGAPGAPGGAAASREAPASPPSDPPSSDPPPSDPPAAPGTRPAPTSVTIPSLDLSEDLVPLGLDGGGTLEVPDDPDRVGWFSGGGRPGGPGPTVVVGHVDSTVGPAVFARLPELVPGDRVSIEVAGGGRTTYEVTEVADVPQSPFPTEEVFGATADDTLRLITCTGPYDAEAGRYTENRVVTAVTVD